MRVVQLGLSNKGFSDGPQEVYENPMTVYLVECVFKRVKGTDSAQIPALLISNCVIAMKVA